MAELWFCPDEAGGDTSNAILACDDASLQIFEDLQLLSVIGPDGLMLDRPNACRPLRAGLWELRWLVRPGSWAIVFVSWVARMNGYLVVNVVRSTAGVATKDDISTALKRRKRYE